jgi:hypothetical protein
MRRFGWRLLFVVGFLPLGFPVVLWCFGAIVVSALAWLVLGPDERDGGRLERWTLGRVCTALDWPLDRLMRKADVLRDLWMTK